jgi:hypothetical protein
MTAILNLPYSNKIKNELAHCIGSEQYFKMSSFPSLTYTEGVKYMYERCKAYWLLQAVASYQYKLKDEYFQVWTLTRTEGNEAVLKADDGNGNILVTQKIPFTDFPLDEIKLYFVDNILLLPSEY